MERFRELTKTNENHYADSCKYLQGFTLAQRECDELKSQLHQRDTALVEAREDKARMDWLCSDPNGEVSFTIRDGVSRTSDARCLREAIDEEMDKSTSQIQAVKP